MSTYSFCITYTRDQALADGVLIDVTQEARKAAGFAWPVALTTRAWSDCVAWSDEDSDKQVHQDEPGRLWDVLSMASIAIRNAGDLSQVEYDFLCIPRDGTSMESMIARLKVVAGPGDNGEPVITIMLPWED